MLTHVLYKLLAGGGECMLWALKRSEAENLMIGIKRARYLRDNGTREVDICRPGESSCLGKFDRTTRRQEKNKQTSRKGMNLTWMRQATRRREAKGITWQAGWTPDSQICWIYFTCPSGKEPIGNIWSKGGLFEKWNSEGDWTILLFIRFTRANQIFFSASLARFETSYRGEALHCGEPLIGCAFWKTF